MPSEPKRVAAEPTPARKDFTPAREAARPASGVRSTAREYGQAFLVAGILAFLIKAFVIQAFKIPSGSMLPTLQIGDHILVNKFIYGVRLPMVGTQVVPLGTPHRGDVIVFAYPQDPTKDFIKRVVAVAGDVVEVRAKKLYVNGELAEDPHASWVEGASGRTVPPRDTFGPFTVPTGKVFVMGDNRDRSYDSRFWGPVDLDAIKGKAFFVYWSWSATNWSLHPRDYGVRWERIGDLIY